MSRESAGLLLIGSGRPNLVVLENIARKRITLGAVTLVSPDPLQLCSGMAPGFVTGRHTIEDMTVDLPSLMRSIGGEFREGSVRGLDAAAHTATLDDGSTLPWDLASIAIGGLTTDAAVPGVRALAKFVKPISRLLELHAALDAAAQGAGPEPLQIVVVGGGSVGFEHALAVRAKLDQLGANRAIISLVDSTHTPLRDGGTTARNAAELALKKAEITLRLSSAVEEVGANHVRLTGGRLIPVDIVIWTVGTEAPPLFRASGLPTDAHGCLIVEDTLAVAGCPGLFGAGGSVSLRSNPRASRSGAFPERMGRVLAHNLGLAAGGRKGAATSYVPGSRAFTLLDLSNGSAIFGYRAFVITAGWALWLRDAIDRRLVRRFQRLYS
jgi:NADH dehydrogenase FAD-containing subunit